MSPIVQATSTIAVLGCISLLGWLIVDRIALTPRPLTSIGLSFPIGGGVFTWALFIFSWIGIPLTLPYVLIILLTVICAALVWRKADHSRTGGIRKPHYLRNSLRSLFGNPLAWIPVLALTLIALTALILSVGKSYAAWDAVAMWGIKGMGIAHEASIFAGIRWGAHGLSYPLNIHLLISLFNLGVTDQIPGSKLIFPVFFISCLIVAYDFWRHQGSTRVWALLGAILLSSVGIHFSHATIGYANLPTGVYILFGVLIGAGGLVRNDRRRLVMASICLGLGWWTIIEGMFFALSIAFLILGAGLIKGWRDSKLLAIMLPMLLIGGSWFIFYLIHGASGSQAMGAADEMRRSIFSGEWNLYAFRMMFGYFRRHWLHLSTWGLFFPTCLVLILAGWKSLSERNRHIASVVLGGSIATGLVSVQLFYLRYFVSEDFYAYMIRGFPRELIPTTLLLGTAAVLVGSSAVRRK